mmetsp:Transcript_43471/g.112598  ORF Transcript_43471/g.112598 Transcript_43471/m.112598 type:complete len:244 (+) Transcript_43471:464-1195(+)
MSASCRQGEPSSSSASTATKRNSCSRSTKSLTACSSPRCTSNSATTVSASGCASQLRLEISPVSGRAIPRRKKMAAVCANTRLQPLIRPVRKLRSPGKVSREERSDSREPKPATSIHPSASGSPVKASSTSWPATNAAPPSETIVPTTSPGAALAVQRAGPDLGRHGVRRAAVGARLLVARLPLSVVGLASLLLIRWPQLRNGAGLHQESCPVLVASCPGLFCPLTCRRGGGGGLDASNNLVG